MIGDGEGGWWVRTEKDDVTPFLPVLNETQLGHGPDEVTAGDDRQRAHTQTT